MSEPLLLYKNNGFYRAADLEFSGARAYFTTRHYDMAFEAGGRCKGYRAMDIDGASIVCPSQVHGERICQVGLRQRGRGAVARATAIQDTDALMTDTAGVPVAVLTADCLPILIFASRVRAVAAVHAGWRGIKQEIIVKTLQQMVRVFGADLGEAVVLLGPAIRSCCYEVGREFCRYFPDAVISRSNRIYFDIAAQATRQLEATGVSPGHIYDSRICTFCAADEFFSFRREGQAAGRSMALIEILAP